MDLALTGRRALVLGGGRGLGRGVAVALAAEGAVVTLAGRTEADLDRTRALIEAASPGARTKALRADFGDPSSIDALAEASGETDILFLNGGGPPPAQAATVSDEAMRAAFELMTIGPIRLARALLPGMRARGFGRILVVLSSGVIQPIPNLVISNAVRMSMVGWLKTLASEVAADGVTVNGLAPGRIHTDRIDFLDRQAAERTGGDLDAVRAASRRAIPAGRYGEVEEFAAVATFLASRQAAYVTGSIVRVDGGLIQSV